jgi:RNA polymerase sigma-70 factor (ECF subfamily)
MERYRGGDVRAFEVLFDRHRRSVYSFILKYVSDQGRAEEILQETFLRVIKKQRTFKRRSKFSTWLYTIARNLCIDKLRRMKHRKARSLDQPLKRDEKDGQKLYDKIPGKDRDAESRVLDWEIRQRVEEAVAQLPDDQKEVFLLREVSRLPFKEIAEVVGCPENTVKSRMRYALERLRKSLSDFEAVVRPQVGEQVGRG